MSNVQVLERTTHRTPLGLQVWDIATATHLIEGLEIQITSGTRAIGTRAFANRSGVYCAFNISGLQQQFELNENDTDAWKTQRRPYQIEVRDPAGRFLPFVFDADLPIRDLMIWLTSRTLLPQPFIFPTDQSSKPMIQRIPLFSSVSRSVPDTLAVVRAELREINTNRPAAWSLLKVSIDTTVLGIGLADQKGRVAILFPYPKRSSPVLPSTPPATNAFRWDIELTAYYTPWQTAIPDAPDLAYLVKQFDSPRKLIQSMEFPTQALSAQVLEYRKPLTVRTEISATEKPLPFLFVNTA
jgi:hypothetical protein